MKEISMIELAEVYEENILNVKKYIKKLTNARSEETNNTIRDKISNKISESNTILSELIQSLHSIRAYPKGE